MSLFDYFRSSYNLGEQFTNILCQTKDIEDGISGTMTHYWLDPKGVLWYPDYTGTQTFYEVEEGDPEYNEKFKFFNFKYKPNGVHGKYIPHRITKYVEVYPVDWKGDWHDWPRMRLHLIDGKLQDFKEIKRRYK